MFGATTLSNVETITLTAGHSYKLTLANETVAAGQTLTVKGMGLASGQTLTFDGSADVTGGNFDIYAGAGDDSLTGGNGDDRFHPGAGADTIHGGGGSDSVLMDANFGASDAIDGGAGADVVYLNGDYSGGVTFGATTLTNVEALGLNAGHSYTLTIADATVAAGQSLVVRGWALGGGETLVFDGSADTTGGTLTINAGAGNDTLTGGHGDDVIKGGEGTNSIAGGLGADRLFGGADADQFVYAGAGDSTSTTYDTVDGFNANSDSFKLVGIAVNTIDGGLQTGQLRAVHFDSDLAAAINAGHLSAHGVALFKPDSGGLHGHVFLVVDVNGTAGYQAGQDLVVELTNAAHLGHLTTANFTS